ncbi:hypothetical protein PHLCEN_2v12311 [Hermanssonia centrifuga]|uniref:Cytochrome P450 n=1 Tax=Hermanssonia centrifuga TaxID=98765 RepID=A0A2R6NHG4_9APHY|nr:hypothetical protein PHLCEN_2v12311 [Hermanssonia centrifuga]
MAIALLTPSNVVAVLFGVAILLLKHFRSSSRALPPGPTPLPIIGNLFDIPTERPWETYATWSRRWGDLLSVTLLGQPLIIINSLQTAVELLDKRGAIYSDRPQLFSADKIGHTKLTPLMTYGSQFREQRRMMAQCIGSRALVEKYGPLQQREVNRFLLRILRKPEGLSAHIRRLVGAVILLISHGYQVNPEGHDRFLSLADACTDDFANSTLPGSFLVDYIPIMRYIPSWIPGAGWRQKLDRYHQNLLAFGQEPLDYTKEQMASGTALPSFTSRNLETNPSSIEFEDNLKWTGVALVGGGSDTTVSSIYTFFLAMTLYPDVQRKAQNEIDTVIGNERLPSFQDRDRLPYVDAVCSEIFRWIAVGPLGVPRRMTEDDTYDGYHLPKGSLLVPNIWKMLHDPEVYPDPMEFKPERFMASPGREPELDPHSVAFGFGRR